MGFEWVDREGLKRSLIDRRFLLQDLHAAGDITDKAYATWINKLLDEAKENGLSFSGIDLEVVE